MPLRVDNGIPIVPVELPDDLGPMFNLDEFEHAHAAPLWSENLDVEHQHQKTDSWCWAASATMAVRFKRPGLSHADVKQCRFVQNLLDRLGEADGAACCTNPVPDTCADKGCSEDDMVPALADFGVETQRLHGAADFATVKGEIHDNRPVIVAIKWNSGNNSGHIVVVRGWRRTPNGGTFLQVNDPLGGDETSGPLGGEIAHDELMNAHGTGRWVWTWHHVGA